MLGQIQLKKEIGKRLKEAREAAGFLTAKDFCSAHNLPVEKYQGHEDGKRSLRASEAIEYSRIFNKPLNWLLLLELHEKE